MKERIWVIGIISIVLIVAIIGLLIGAGVIGGAPRVKLTLPEGVSECHLADDHYSGVVTLGPHEHKQTVELHTRNIFSISNVKFDKDPRVKVGNYSTDMTEEYIFGNDGSTTAAFHLSFDYKYCT